MRERGHQQFPCLRDDPELEPKLLQVHGNAVYGSESVREGHGRTVVRNLK